MGYGGPGIRGSAQSQRVLQPWPKMQTLRETSASSSRRGCGCHLLSGNDRLLSEPYYPKGSYLYSRMQAVKMGNISMIWGSFPHNSAFDPMQFGQIERVWGHILPDTIILLLSPLYDSTLPPRLQLGMKGLEVLSSVQGSKFKI